MYIRECNICLLLSLYIQFFSSPFVGVFHLSWLARMMVIHHHVAVCSHRVRGKMKIISFNKTSHRTTKCIESNNAFSAVYVYTSRHKTWIAHFAPSHALRASFINILIFSFFFPCISTFQLLRVSNPYHKYQWICVLPIWHHSPAGIFHREILNSSETFLMFPCRI